MEQATDERFTWTLALIDATLALRFKDERLRDDIESARGNEAKRKAWHALALRLQKEQGISVPESKLRRVISKWQSQHRAWTQAVVSKSASELALMDRPPTYMPVLQRYFKDESKGSMGESSSVAFPVPLPEPTTIPQDDGDDEDSTQDSLLHKKHSIGDPPKRPQRPVLAYDIPEPKQRKLGDKPPVEAVQEVPRLYIVSPVKTNQAQLQVTCSTSTACTATFVDRTVEAADVTSIVDPKASGVRDLLARATQRLSDIQKEQLTLQKTHFEEQLAMQRKQYDEQFSVQREQVEAVHSILASLHGSIDV